MKKALFKIIIPVCVLVLWMITCYPVCNKADGFDYFLYWILVGGLIGGIIVLVRIIVIFTEIIKVIAGHFWTQCPKV